MNILWNKVRLLLLVQARVGPELKELHGFNVPDDKY